MSTIHAIAKKYVQRLQKKGIPIQKAFLFGSYIKGTQKIESDIDIGIFTEDIFQFSFDDQIKARTERWNIDLRIEPHFFSARELKYTSNPVVENIKTTGQEVLT